MKTHLRSGRKAARSRLKHQMLRAFESTGRNRSRSIFKFCSGKRNSGGGPEDRDSLYQLGANDTRNVRKIMP
jgi:hypothetical protein